MIMRNHRNPVLPLLLRGRDGKSYFHLSARESTGSTVLPLHLWSGSKPNRSQLCVRGSACGLNISEEEFTTSFGQAKKICAAINNLIKSITTSTQGLNYIRT